MLRLLTPSLCAIALLVSPALAADCAGTHAVDRCLVGRWQMTTNGMEQWMRAHIHKFHVTSVQSRDNTITLNADGTFETGASNVTVHGEGGNGTAGVGTMNAQARGSWSAAGGMFNICARSSTMTGTARVTGPSGSTTTPTTPVAVPPVSTRAYTCAGNSFTISQPLHGDTVVSTYTKIP